MESSSSTSPPADAAIAAAASGKAATRFSFQHFDQESDFGVEDENGERVRKRKRPGRKPNPPTLQERRAQNRAAQRAFREREQQRRQEKERENQLHLEELIRTRKRLAEVQYEANYLRGCVLLLCMTNLVERGSVPHIWTDTRVFPIPWVGMPPSPPNDNVNSIPAILKTVLGKNNQILDFQSSLMTARCTGWSLPSQIEQLLNGVDSFIPQESAAEKSTHSKTNTSPSILSTMQQHREQKRKEQLERMREEDSEDEDSLSASTGTESMVSNFTATKNVYGTVTDTPTLKTPDDLTHMPPLQALHILRLQLKSSSILGDKTRISLTPSKHFQSINGIFAHTNPKRKPPCND
ncbi:hypothetical protein BJV82DRAFT_219893 [Fennellomyces sp. T-0311]|nr:hypothetical protein BJV82DRAFT_219893 [Fennellomyces sp. T-0311]